MCDPELAMDTEKCHNAVLFIPVIIFGGCRTGRGCAWRSGWSAAAEMCFSIWLNMMAWTGNKKIPI
jgi:hypothetical protein